MEDDDKMPNVLDRRRLKDRIIEGVSKAVKKVGINCHFVLVSQCIFLQI